METQGLLEMFEDQLALSRTQGQEQGRAMVDQMMAGLNPTPEFSARFDQAFDQFMSEIETPWSASEIVSVWSKYYGEYFTEDELSQLIKHYESPLGQKEITASRESMVKYSNHFSEAGKPILEKAVANYVKNLRLIAKECNCRR